MYPLFLRMLRYYVQMDETRPNGGIVQVLDIPQNLDALGDLDAHVGGIQLPLYDGVHFCHAIFAPKALKAMKEYLDINLPPVQECDWSLKKFDTVPAFTKSRDFTTGTHADMEEDYVIFCQIKRWRLISRVDCDAPTRFVILVEDANMEQEVLASAAFMSERVRNHQFPCFAKRDLDFYCGARFLATYFDHPCVRWAEKEFHRFPYVQTVCEHFATTWKSTIAGVQLAAMDRKTGTRRVAPFVVCPATYVMLTRPYRKRVRLMKAMALRILQLAGPKLRRLPRRERNPSLDESAMSATTRFCPDDSSFSGYGKEDLSARLISDSADEERIFRHADDETLGSLQVSDGSQPLAGPSRDLKRPSSIGDERRRKCRRLSVKDSTFKRKKCAPPSSDNSASVNPRCVGLLGSEGFAEMTENVTLDRNSPNDDRLAESTFDDDNDGDNDDFTRTSEELADEFMEKFFSRDEDHDGNDDDDDPRSSEELAIEFMKKFIFRGVDDQWDHDGDGDDDGVDEEMKMHRMEEPKDDCFIVFEDIGIGGAAEGEYKEENEDDDVENVGLDDREVNRLKKRDEGEKDSQDTIDRLTDLFERSQAIETDHESINDEISNDSKENPVDNEEPDGDDEEIDDDGESLDVEGILEEVASIAPHTSRLLRLYLSSLRDAESGEPKVAIDSAEREDNQITMGTNLSHSLNICGPSRNDIQKPSSGVETPVLSAFSETIYDDEPMNFTLDGSKALAGDDHNLAVLDGDDGLTTDDLAPKQVFGDLIDKRSAMLAQKLPAGKSILGDLVGRSLGDLVVIEEVVDLDPRFVDADKNPSNDSFFTADSSSIAGEDRLSAFLSENDDSTVDGENCPSKEGDNEDNGRVDVPHAATRSAIEDMSSQEFMARIAAGGLRNKVSNVDVDKESFVTASSQMTEFMDARSPSDHVASPRASVDLERERLRSLSQSASEDPKESRRLDALASSASNSQSSVGHESQRLNSLSSPKRVRAKSEAHVTGKRDRLSSSALLNFTFPFLDESRAKEGDEEEEEDSFETISQMELAGVSSYYVIKAKGSPKRSPRGSPNKRTPSSNDDGSPDGQSSRSQERLLQNITPRRPIRDPLERSSFSPNGDGSASMSLNSTPSTSRSTKSTSLPGRRLANADALPSQLDIEDALRFIQQETTVGSGATSTPDDSENSSPANHQRHTFRIKHSQ